MNLTKKNLKRTLLALLLAVIAAASLSGCILVPYDHDEGWHGDRDWDHGHGGHHD